MKNISFSSKIEMSRLGGGEGTDKQVHTRIDGLGGGEGREVESGCLEGLGGGEEWRGGGGGRRV